MVKDRMTVEFEGTAHYVCQSLRQNIRAVAFEVLDTRSINEGTINNWLNEEIFKGILEKKEVFLNWLTKNIMVVRRYAKIWKK